MKLIATRQPLVNGKKIINAYKVTLKKSEVEKAGFKAGDRLKAKYEKCKITLIKDENEEE